MPHDRKGRLLFVGDRVRATAFTIVTVQLAANPECPEESPPHLSLKAHESHVLRGEVVELYEGETACNAQIRFDGALYPATFNTRLVESIEPEPQAEAVAGAELEPAGSGDATGEP